MPPTTATSKSKTAKVAKSGANGGTKKLHNEATNSEVKKPSKFVLPKPNEKTNTGRIVGESQRKKLTGELRSRIVGHANVNPLDLKAHSMNFRKHGAAQVSALSGSMNDLGWVKSVLVSKRTGTIIDGHARVEEALRRKLATVPVEYVDLDANEERKALALIDPITEMATRDEAMFSNLLDSISSDNEQVNEALAKLAPFSDEKMDAYAINESETVGVVYDPNVFFPSSGKYGIPDIDPKMLYSGPAPLTTYPRKDALKAPQLYIYGSNAFDDRVTGRIICFFTEDRRFERVWNDSVSAISTIAPLRPAAFTGVDFSIWPDEPQIVQMWNLYRARWITRFWQGAGIPCIPILQTSPNREVADLCMVGVPRKPPMIATQMRTGGMKTKEQLKITLASISEWIEEIKPQQLVIYGDAAKDRVEGFLPKGTSYVWCQDFTTASFDILKEKRAAKKQAELHSSLGK